MIDYRFHKLYQLYLQLESIDVQDPDITNLKSTDDTRIELIGIRNDINQMIYSFDFMQKKLANSDSRMNYKIQQDKKHFMDRLYKIATAVFELLKHKRTNMQEEFIFKDLYNKINDLSQIKFDDDNIMKIKEELDNISKYLNDSIKMFHKSFFSGLYSFNAPKYQPKNDW